MKWNEIIQIVLFFGLGIALTPPVGRFMARVFKGERTFLHPILSPVEKVIYRLTGVDPNRGDVLAALLLGRAALRHGGLRGGHGDIHDAAVAAAQSAESAQLPLAPGLHAGLELHLQRRLAVLRGGNDHELLFPNLRHHGPSIPERGLGPGGAGGGRDGPCAGLRSKRWAISGRT